MKNLVFACTVMTLVTACGGGGGGDGDGAAPVSAVPANKLANYVGTWSADCDSRSVDSVTITSPANNTLKLNVRTDYYAGANCTGAIIATELEGADITATYVETIDSSIAFAEGAAAVPAKVDKITASMPQHNKSVTGTGVTHVVENGQPMWCVDFGGGNKTCIWDEGTYAAESGQTGGLALQGNVLYELMPKGSLYLAYGRYTKK